MPEIAKTADQALTILLEVAERGPSSATELSRSLGLNRTVVHRLLSTLQRRAFVRRQGDGYVLGSVFVELAESVEPMLRRIAQPVLQRLAREVGETVVLSIPDNPEVVVLDQYLGGDNLVRVQHRIGSRHALHVGATGRALLAFMPQSVVDRVLRRVEDAERVRTLLAEVQSLGYSVSHDELQAGVYGTAAPVLDSEGVAFAAVGIIVPLTRTPSGDEHTTRVKVAAADLAAALQADAVPRSAVRRPVRV